jgi:alpha-beta hydrolase superfamily lysophospholipase
MGVLLLHGMSDSPYSLRNLGERLHAAGAWVVGLRLPGHGTAPSGLTTIHWQDMAAAVRLAMEHLREKVGDRPLYLVGYSNGGALAVHYALTALEDSTLPSAKGLVLISPAIGVTPLAALAVWQARLGHLLGLPKLEWNSVLPEYDPFKYSSFAVNAGDQTYRLTLEIRSRLEALRGSSDLKQFPRVLAFQSAVDATVSAPVLVKALFEGLPQGGHELVLFDINRSTKIEQVLKEDPKKGIETLFGDASLPFTLSLVTNENEQTRHAVVRRKRPGDTRISELALDLDWPEGLYSLSHVALPFPVNDPLYGGAESVDSPGIRLGSLALRGERGVLRVSASDMLRLRWNPFYPYLERRVIEFVKPGATSE